MLFPRGIFEKADLRSFQIHTIYFILNVVFVLVDLFVSLSVLSYKKNCATRSRDQEYYGIIWEPKLVQCLVENTFFDQWMGPEQIQYHKLL